MNNIEILEDYKKLMENLYRFIDDDMGGHFEPVVGNQKANTMLGYLVFERELENLIQENKELRIQISARETVVDKLTKENKDLKEENHTLKEKLQMFIPRRRVRRVYKMLGKILRTDIDPILLEKELKQKDLEEGE